MQVDFIRKTASVLSRLWVECGIISVQSLIRFFHNKQGEEMKKALWAVIGILTVAAAIFAFKEAADRAKVERDIAQMKAEMQAEQSPYSIMAVVSDNLPHPGEVKEYAAGDILGIHARFRFPDEFESVQKTEFTVNPWGENGVQLAGGTTVELNSGEYTVLHVFDFGRPTEPEVPTQVILYYDGREGDIFRFRLMWILPPAPAP